MARPRRNEPRSELTKQRILDAAQRKFSEEGYERTTIRSVAAEAEIDPSMVMRYFGSKDGLFAAATSFDIDFPDLVALRRKERGKRLAQHFVQLWGHNETGRRLAILLRSAATNDRAAEGVLAILRHQVLPVIEAISADAPSERAALITSQILGMAYCRYLIRIPEITALDDDAIVAALGPTIQRYLDDVIVVGQSRNKKVPL